MTRGDKSPLLRGLEAHFQRDRQICAPSPSGMDVQISQDQEDLVDRLEAMVEELRSNQLLDLRPLQKAVTKAELALEAGYDKPKWCNPKCLGGGKNSKYLPHHGVYNETAQCRHCKRWIYVRRTMNSERLSPHMSKKPEQR